MKCYIKQTNALAPLGGIALALKGPACRVACDFPDLCPLAFCLLPFCPVTLPHFSTYLPYISLSSIYGLSLHSPRHALCHDTPHSLICSCGQANGRKLTSYIPLSHSFVPSLSCQDCRSRSIIVDFSTVSDLHLAQFTPPTQVQTYSTSDFTFYTASTFVSHCMKSEIDTPEAFARSYCLEPCGDGGPSFEWR